MKQLFENKPGFIFRREKALRMVKEGSAHETENIVR
jgi:hypothetical protein